MTLARAIIALLLAAQPAAAFDVDPNPPAMLGVDRPDRARVNYILKCQGCHGPRAEGNRTRTPPMAGTVARFLAVPEGRAYLARVPGVATAAIGDAELAELLNWTVQHFDAAHLPRSFVPYTAAEIGGLRRMPLRTEASAVRQALIARLATGPVGIGRNSAKAGVASIGSSDRWRTRQDSNL